MANSKRKSLKLPTICVTALTISYWQIILIYHYKYLILQQLFQILNKEEQ